MSGDGISSGNVQRGMLLKEQRRYREAEEYFRGALAQNPHDHFALMQLATCQLHQEGSGKAALQSIDAALALEPNEAIYHGMRAYILCSLDRGAEALKSARQGLEISPDSPFLFTAEAQACLRMEKWADAESAARNALSLDANDATAANQLAQALRLQNKMDENAGQIAGMLARDPEDAATHCSAGWSALQRGQRREAEQHFMEALRLDPESENARNGLLHSFRARSPFYRGYLAYCFWMQRLGRNMRWAVILGLYFGSKFARAFFTGAMAPVGIAVTVLYLLFVLWVWVAKGVGNFILLFDRFARHALLRNEKIEACFVGSGIGLGIVLLGVGFAMKQPGLLLPGAALIASAFPLSMTFTNPSHSGRILFGIIGATALLAFAVLMLDFILNGALPEGLTMGLFAIGVGGAALSTWLGNIPSLRR